MKLIEPVKPEDLAAVRAWFDTLSRHCRTVDYEGARPIFAEDMIAFGTFTDFMHGREGAEGGRGRQSRKGDRGWQRRSEAATRRIGDRHQGLWSHG